MIFRSFFRPRRGKLFGLRQSLPRSAGSGHGRECFRKVCRPAGFGLPPGKAASPLQFPCEAAGRLPSRPRPCWKLASSALSHSETGGPPHFSSAPSSRSLSCQSSNSAPISCANSRSVCVSSFFSSSSTSKAKLPGPYLFHAAAAAGSGQEPTDTEMQSGSVSRADQWNHAASFSAPRRSGCGTPLPRRYGCGRHPSIPFWQNTWPVSSLYIAVGIIVKETSGKCNLRSVEWCGFCHNLRWKIIEIME